MAINTQNNKKLKILFWLIPIVLFIFQLIFTLNSMSQIRYEELAESVRNVYWFQNRIIYDGTSSNVGWYSTLLIIYNLFGFSLFTAKIFRLLLYFISVICLVLLLKKYFGYKNSLLPLITIGLSPTLIFFTSLQAQFGIDLQTVPILLYLILTLDFKRKTQSIIKQILIGLIAIFTWTSYPTFIYYLPAIIFLYFQKTRNTLNLKCEVRNGSVDQEVGSGKSHISPRSEATLHSRLQLPISHMSFQSFLNYFLPLLSFLAPLIFFFLYIKNRNLLIYDTVTQSGIFRGAGKLELNLNIILQNISKLLTDLFDKGNSYYFEIISPDFSNFYPIITVLFVLIFSIILIIKHKKLRIFLLFNLSVLVLTLIISNITSDPSNNPGIRRNTGFLASFYVLFVICWYYFVNKKWEIQFKNILFLIFLFLPVHHLISFPANLAALKNPSPYQYTMWFGLTNNPATSLKLISNENIKNDLPLSCKDKKGQNAFCRYNETFAAVSGYCLWNKLECKKITGYDNKTKKFIPLSVTLWSNYYWPH